MTSFSIKKRVAETPAPAAEIPAATTNPPEKKAVSFKAPAKTFKVSKPEPVKAPTPAEDSVAEMQEPTPDTAELVAMPAGVGEVPANEIERILPEGATEPMLAFVALLDSVPKLFHDPETMKHQVRNIMVALQEEESFVEMIMPQDLQHIIRGMRETLEGAAIKKAAKKRAPAKKKLTKLSADDMADLDSLMAGHL